VRVTRKEHVQEAVKCAAAAGATISARSGAHSFDNQACAGDVIIDVSPLDSFDRAPGDVVTFGSGHLHGQLYYKLSQHGLVVAGGAENGVGTAGLWLGCGRGPLTVIHGLSCDSIRAIEYVDATGGLRTADARHNADMYWMARGGGGEFPGIVTNFTAQAHRMPQRVRQIVCNFDARATGWWVIKAWAENLQEMQDPNRKLFTHIKVLGGNGGGLYGSCFDCSPAEYDWLIAACVGALPHPCLAK